MSLPPRLGRLEQVSRLGVGSFASVWLYRDDTLDSLVAVKALADNWAQRTDVRERFLEEARILRRADSDHVVRVYDVGETSDGTPYFVMSYANQGTVADLLPAAPLPLERVADLVADAASGLGVLHRIGVVHRDVKPQNLLLHGSRDQSRLVVADLGVAKALAHATGLTMVVGTPAYMAPEQADPGAGTDRRADVHALGAVAYHLLTGRMVRAGGAESVLQPVDPAPASHLVPELPAGVDAVLARALARDREQRWPDVAAFAQALRTAASGGPARPLAGLRPQRGSRRRVRVGVPALAVAVVVAGSAIAWYVVDDADGTGAQPAATEQSPDPGDLPSTQPPTVRLPAGWSRAAAVGSVVTYRQPELDLELVVSAQGSTRPPRQAAAAALTPLGAGVEVLVDERLPVSQRLGWPSAWRIRYVDESAEPRRVRELWHVGEDGSTAGSVALSAPADGDPAVVELVSRALAALPPPGEPQLVGTPDFPGGDLLSTELGGGPRTDVALLQAGLNAAGFPIDVDGDYGPLTAEAVRLYQAERDLVVDGKVGPQTWAALVD